MTPATERLVNVVYKIILIGLAILTTGGAIIWRVARLETRVEAIYSKVESIERKLHNGTENQKSNQRFAGIEGDETDIR